MDVVLHKVASIRLTRAEHRRLVEQAVAEGKTLSQLLREKILPTDRPTSVQLAFRVRK